MERKNKVVPMQLISEENESDAETSCENDDDGLDEVSRPTLSSKISNESNDSISSEHLYKFQQPRQSRAGKPSKPNVRFGVRRRRSSFEKVLKESDNTDTAESKTSRRTSCFSILQTEIKVRNGVDLHNGSATEVDNTYDVLAEPAMERDECAEEQNLTLLRYVSQITDSAEVDASIDLEQVRTLIKSGVSVNSTDLRGQTILHEAARSWSLEVAHVLVDEGADVNATDKFGRTPLHVAASVDYNAMVKFLMEQGAHVDARTTIESQTPLHYAARNEAVPCAKTLLVYGAEIDVRDYKQRTPLQVAAEYDSAETAEVLLNKGASARVKDDSGLSVLVLFILKMPSVALRALDQFHVIDRTHRKQYMYLNYIENLERCFAPSPLQTVVETNCYELIMHPLFQRLIEIKWDYLGRRSAWMDIVPNVFLAILYTVLGVTYPDKITEHYNPTGSTWWRIAIEIIILALLINELRKEVREFLSSKAKYSEWIAWRSNEIKRDLEYCHPRCPQEKMFVERQVESAREQRKDTYFQEIWNYLDWLAYAMLIVVFTLHFVSVVKEDDAFNMKVIQIMSCTLIVVWIRMLKFARPFPVQGPFVVILDHIIVDTFRWSFIFLMIYIPYGAAFWMNFGGRSEKAEPGYGDVFELMFTMLRFPIVDSNNYTHIEKRSSFMARLLGATYLVIGALILMNMFIALMSNTFQRVYDNATATAAMQRARLIQAVEPSNLLNSDDKYRDFINSHCCPEQRDYLVIVTEQEDQNRKQEEKISRLHSIINLRLGGKKFGKLDKSEFELALEDIDSLKASVVQTNFLLKTLAEKLEQIGDSIRQDVVALNISQNQRITELKDDQERDFKHLKGVIDSKTEGLTLFQAKKIEELVVFQAKSVGQLQFVHTKGHEELKLHQAQNTEELKVLQAEGVEEIKLQQALGFADLKLTQVQCSEELKPSPLQNGQQNKRSQQELKPFQVQMLEDLKRAKEQKFQNLKLSEEQDFEEIGLFQATTFENLKLSGQHEFKEMTISKDEQFEELTRTHAKRWTGQSLSEVQTRDSSGTVQPVIYQPGEGIKAFDGRNTTLQSIAEMKHTQNKAIESMKAYQTKLIEDLKHLQASNVDRLRRSQAESLLQLKQPEDLTSLSAKYEKLDKERERVQSEGRYIGGLTKVYAVQKGAVNKAGRERRRDHKISKAWGQISEQEQGHANTSEKEGSEGESLKSLSAKSSNDRGTGERVAPEKTRADGSRESFIALEELSEGNYNSSSAPRAITEREENKKERAPGPEELSQVKTRVDDSQRKPEISDNNSQENEEEHASSSPKEDCKNELSEDETSQDTPSEVRSAASLGSFKQENIIENNLTNQDCVKGIRNEKEKRLYSKKESKTVANASEERQEDKAHEGDCTRDYQSDNHNTSSRQICSKKQEAESQRRPSHEQHVSDLATEFYEVETRRASVEELGNVERSKQGGRTRDEQSEGNSGSAESLEELEVVKKKDSAPKEEATYSDTSEEEETSSSDVHQRTFSRGNQSEDKKKLSSSTNSEAKENETRSITTQQNSTSHSSGGSVYNARQRAEEKGKTDEEVGGVKTVAQGKGKMKASVAKERLATTRNDEPSVNLETREQEKGPTRSNNDHIASLMHLYGGMKVSAKKKRLAQKNKVTEKTRKKDN